MTIVFVRLTPKASQDRIDGWAEDDKGRAYLKIRLTAPPVEGRANLALIVFMGRMLDVPKSRITLLSDDTVRLKKLEIDDMTDADLHARLKLSYP